jgi:hypothetical protein
MRSLRLVAACGAFVAVLRNHAKIVRAHANRESPKPAARPFPVGSHSLSRCAQRTRAAFARPGAAMSSNLDAAASPWPVLP